MSPEVIRNSFALKKKLRSLRRWVTDVKEKIERVDNVKVVQVLESNTRLTELGARRLETISDKNISI